MPVAVGSLVKSFPLVLFIPIFPEKLEDSDQVFLEKLCKVFWPKKGSEGKRAEVWNNTKKALNTSMSILI